MNISVQQVENKYILNISYTVTSTIEEVWNFLATSQGQAQWFPELHMEDTGPLGPILVFEVGNFRKEIDVTIYRKPEHFAFVWDLARIEFRLTSIEQGCLLEFQEIIPCDYQNQFANASQDMTGWTVHNQRLQKLLSGQEAALVEEMNEFCQQQINDQVLKAQAAELDNL